METTKNTVTIPVAISRKMGIKPGCRLEWREGREPDQILLRVIPDRSELGRRLLGKGRVLAPERDAVAELVAARAVEG